MNALQSLITSGVHAICSSGVPCEEEAAGDAVTESNASDTHHLTKGIRMFMAGLTCIIETDTGVSWKYTFAGVGACSEMSAFGAFDPSVSVRIDRQVVTRLSKR